MQQKHKKEGKVVCPCFVGVDAHLWHQPQSSSRRLLSGGRLRVLCKRLKRNLYILIVHISF